MRQQFRSEGGGIARRAPRRQAAGGSRRGAVASLCGPAIGCRRRCAVAGRLVAPGHLGGAPHPTWPSGALVLIAAEAYHVTSWNVAGPNVLAIAGAPRNNSTQCLKEEIPHGMPSVILAFGGG